ncbi:hypothetical protein BUE80_DR002407 [Diplocarpon rosae]|nr:hypothetical protein BUE80_DR002407 [Diplocarpon rosae]
MLTTKTNHLVFDTSNTSPPSESEIYSVARVAYEKLAEEAACGDKDLRRLVGHANLYDQLLVEITNSLSNSDSESSSDGDDEFPAQAPPTYSAAAQVDATYIYQGPGPDPDQQQVGADGEVAFGAGTLAGMEDLELCRVASRSGSVGCHLMAGCVEVEVAETEIFDDDCRDG